MDAAQRANLFRRRKRVRSPFAVAQQLFVGSFTLLPAVAPDLTASHQRVGPGSRLTERRQQDEQATRTFRESRSVATYAFVA
jgi:hypothetical protein